MKPLPPLDIGEDRSPARPSGAASRRVAPEASNKGSSKLNTRQSEAGDPWWETLPGIVNSAAAVGSEQSGKLGKSVSFSDSAGAEAPTAAAALRSEFTEQEIIFLTVAVANINAWNRIAGPLRFPQPANTGGKR